MIECPICGKNDWMLMNFNRGFWFWQVETHFIVCCNCSGMFAPTGKFEKLYYEMAKTSNRNPMTIRIFQNKGLSSSG